MTVKAFFKGAWQFFSYLFVLQRGRGKAVNKDLEYLEPF